MPNDDLNNMYQIATFRLIPLSSFLRFIYLSFYFPFYVLLSHITLNFIVVRACSFPRPIQRHNYCDEVRLCVGALPNILLLF